MLTESTILSQPTATRELHKFGGSSLADPICFQRVISILTEFSTSDDLIVVSAAGDTTNRLLAWLDTRIEHPDLAEQQLTQLYEFQKGLIEQLLPIEQAKDLTTRLQSDITELKSYQNRALSESKTATIIGFGECWSVRLLSALLNVNQLPATTLDSRLFLRAEKAVQPEVNRGLSWPLLMEQLTQHHGHRIVITGFMAQNQAGETVLLGRNGSDYSATVIGALAEVLKVTIWSDVAGVFSADPRKVNDACLLPLLRLDEANELARLGAPVLHHRTLQPIAQSTTDLMLRSSHRPNVGSTKIERILASGCGAKIVTALNNIAVIDIQIPESHDFAHNKIELEQLLAHHQLSPLVLHTDEQQQVISVAYKQDLMANVHDIIVKSSIDGEVSIKEQCDLIAIVGAGVSKNEHHCHFFYQQLAQESVDFIAMSETELSLIAVLSTSDTDRLVSHIHSAVFQATAD
ncbi:aspartate kinase [Vibrio sp. SS-MA-C1-2]|uniref:aspartate kinase n=1 Tax=Vibrio sp. SS-MA-C1-2 TaxID=2908646 RepID=UPI001F31A277|nr:aspartate kinase [Vibrio sp. SS-MA-C1-2]UJF19237.1 aspartate kinase [Vibrio sp. SS-MA-C1-2]